MKKNSNYNTLQNYSKKKENYQNSPYKTVSETENNKSNNQKKIPLPLPNGDIRDIQQQAPPKKTLLRYVDSKQAFNLLTNSQHHTKNGIPMKVVLYCSASWCDPCKLLLPKMEDITLEPQYKSISFLKIDCSNPDDLCTELRNLLNIDAVPIIYSFLGDKQVNMVAGSNIAEIENLCNQLVVA